MIGLLRLYVTADDLFSCSTDILLAQLRSDRQEHNADVD